MNEDKSKHFPKRLCERESAKHLPRNHQEISAADESGELVLQGVETRTPC